MNTATSAVSGSRAEKEQAALHGRALWISVLVDLVTCVPYALIAILSGSMMLLSDVADYFKSFATHGVALSILRKIRLGQIQEFDYGAGKLERIGSLIGALFYIGSLVAVAVFSIYRLIEPVALDSTFATVGMLVQFIVIAVNGYLWIYYKRISDKSPAPLMDMAWRHKRVDTVVAGGILIALGLTIVFQGETWAMYLDPACGLIYAIVAIGSYVPALRESLHDLLDRTLGEDLQIIVMRELAGHFDGYEAFHGVRSRRAGNRLFIEIALGFDPAKTVGEAEATIESLRAGVEAAIPNAEVSVVIKPLQQPVSGGAEADDEITNTPTTSP